MPDSQNAAGNRPASDNNLRSGTDSPKSDPKATLTPPLQHGPPHSGGRGQRGRVFQDLTTGSIPKKLFLQSWPQVTENIMLIADQLIDLVWAARLPQGFRAVAGIGVGQTVVQVGQTARQGLDHSLRAMVSRAVGAGNIPLANHIVMQALTLNIVYSIIFIIVGQIFAEVVMKLFSGGGSGITSEAVTYVRVYLIQISLVGLRQVGGTALQSSSDVMTPFRAVVVQRVIHIVLTPFFMFGWWWFPGMGVAGAAASTSVSLAVSNVMVYYALFKGNSRLKLTFKGYKFDKKMSWQMIKIGAPASVVSSERAASQVVLLGLAAGFGEITLAAYAIVRRLENVLNFGSMGIAQASGVMVGQSLGAGRPERARKVVLWGLVYSNVVPGVVRLFLLFSPTLFARLFASDSEVVNTTAAWLQVQVLAVFFLSMSNIFAQSYNSAGDTITPMIVTLIGVWVIEIPLAFYLVNTDMGAIGLLWAAVAGTAIRLLFYAPYLFSDRWLKVKVL